MIRLTKFEIDENNEQNDPQQQSAMGQNNDDDYYDGEYSEEDEDDNDSSLGDESTILNQSPTTSQNSRHHIDTFDPRIEPKRKRSARRTYPTDQELLQQGLPSRTVRQYLKHDASNVVMLSPALKSLQSRSCSAEIHNNRLFLPFSSLNNPTTNLNNSSKNNKNDSWISQAEIGGLFALNTDVVNSNFTSSHSNTLIVNSKLPVDQLDQFYPRVRHSSADKSQPFSSTDTTITSTPTKSDKSATTLKNLPDFSIYGPGGINNDANSKSSTPSASNNNNSSSTTTPQQLLQRGYRLNLLTLYNRLYISLHDEASGALLLFTQNDQGTLVQTHTYQTQCRGRCIVSVKNDLISMVQINGDLISFEQYWWNLGEVVPQMKELHKIKNNLKKQTEDLSKNGGAPAVEMIPDSNLDSIDYCYIASRACVVDINSPGTYSMIHQWILLNSLSQETILNKMKKYQKFPPVSQFGLHAQTCVVENVNNNNKESPNTTQNNNCPVLHKLNNHPDKALFGISATSQDQYQRNRLLQLVPDYQPETTYLLSPSSEVYRHHKATSSRVTTSVNTANSLQINPHSPRYIFQPPCYLISVSPDARQGSLSVITPNFSNLVKKASYLQYPLLLSLFSHRAQLVCKYYSLLLIRSMITAEGFSKQANLQHTLLQQQYQIQYHHWQQSKLAHDKEHGQNCSKPWTLSPPIPPPSVLLSDLTPVQDIVVDVLSSTNDIGRRLIPSRTQDDQISPSLAQHFPQFAQLISSNPPPPHNHQQAHLSSTTGRLFDYSASCYCCHIANHQNGYYHKTAPLPSIASSDHLHQVQHQHPHTFTSFSWLLSRSFVSLTKQSLEPVNSVTYYGDHTFINPYQFAQDYQERDEMMNVKVDIVNDASGTNPVRSPTTNHKPSLTSKSNHPDPNKPFTTILTKPLGISTPATTATTSTSAAAATPAPTNSQKNLSANLKTNKSVISGGGWSSSLPLSYFPLKHPLLHVVTVEGSSILTQSDFLHFIYLPLYYHYMTCPHMNLCSTCKIVKHPLANQVHNTNNSKTNDGQHQTQTTLSHSSLCLECLVKQQIRTIHLRFLTNILTEHIRSLCRSQLPVQHQYYIFLILLLIKQQQFQLLHQSLLYGVVDDGLDVVLKLLLMFLNTYQDHAHLESSSVGVYRDLYGPPEQWDSFKGQFPESHSSAALSPTSNQNWLSDIGKHLDITITSSPSADLLILLDEIDIAQAKQKHFQELQLKNTIAQTQNQSSGSSTDRKPQRPHTPQSLTPGSTGSSPLQCPGSSSSSSSRIIDTIKNKVGQLSHSVLSTNLSQNDQFLTESIKKSRSRLIQLKKKRAQKEMMLLQLLHSGNLMNLHPFLNLMNVQGIIYELNYITHPKPHYPYIYTQYLQYVLPIISAKQFDSGDNRNNGNNTSDKSTKGQDLGGKIADYFPNQQHLSHKNNKTQTNHATTAGLSGADYISVKTLFADRNIYPPVSSRISPGELQDILIVEERQQQQHQQHNFSTSTSAQRHQSQSSQNSSQNNSTDLQSGNMIPPTPMIGTTQGFGSNSRNTTPAQQPVQVQNPNHAVVAQAHAPQYPSMSHFLFPFAQDVWISHYAAQLRSLLNQKTAQHQQQLLQQAGQDPFSITPTLLSTSSTNLSELNAYLNVTQDQYLALLQYRHYHSLRFYHTTHVPLNHMYQFIMQLSMYSQFIPSSSQTHHIPPQSTSAPETKPFSPQLQQYLKSNHLPHHMYPIVSILDEILCSSNQITLHSLPPPPPPHNSDPMNPIYKLPSSDPTCQHSTETTSQYLSTIFHTPQAQHALPPNHSITPQTNPDFDLWHQYPRDLTTPVFSKLHSRNNTATLSSNNPLLQYILDTFFRRNFGLQILQHLTHQQQTTTTSALRLVSNKNKLLQTNIKWEMFDSVKMGGSDVHAWSVKKYIDSGKPATG